MRLDLVFHFDLCEVGNGEIKPVRTSKPCVEVARARILETCKRPLHVRLKTCIISNRSYYNFWCACLQSVL
ncbi:hypothetical protein BD770DRAFT_382436 [Pilaira anomala]|nr:hypothetical protein BD770DRAFT_382436 [Pilaira anomala]